MHHKVVEMALNFLSSSYSQYKADTNIIAHWLATTAENCGWASDLLRKQNATQSQPSKRSKGKGPKPAQEPNEKSAPNSSNSGVAKPPTYTIAVKDFVSLAEFIAAFNKPPVHVPSKIVTVIDRAISLRADHGATLSSKLPNNRKSERADESHSYFIGILKKIREVLRPRMSSGVIDDYVTNEAGTPVGKSFLQRLENKFSELDIHEPSEGFLNAPDIELPTPKTNVKYEAEQYGDMNEAYLVLSLLLHDLNRIRHFIRQIWARFSKSELDLTTVSLTTNTAINLARNLENEIKVIFAKYGGMGMMLPSWYGALCLALGQNPNHREQPDDEINFKVYDVADSVFYTSYIILDAFRRLLHHMPFPDYKPGFYGTYDSSKDRSKLSSRQKFKADKVVLAEIFPDVQLLCKGTDGIQAEDEFVREFRNMIKTDQISLVLVFAAQLFLDIHNVMGSNVNKGYADLVEIAKHHDTRLQKQLFGLKFFRIKNWPPHNDLVIRELLEDTKHWVLNDPIQKAKTMQGRAPGEAFRLMKRHPLYCGTWAYNLKSRFHSNAINFVNAYGSIMYSCHLYNAVRSEGFLDKQWKSMETMLSLFGPESLFVGGPPTNIDDYLKQFLLCMGWSATTFAKNRRNVALEASSRGPRALPYLAPIHQTFQGRYHENTGHVDLTAETVGKILQKGSWSKGGDRSTQKEMWEKHERISTIEILDALCTALQSEVQEFGYDFLTIHDSCWLLLRAVQKQCDSDLIKIYGPGYIETESQLPFVVGYVFLTATETKKVGSLLLKKSDIVTSKLLHSTTEPLKKLINGGA